MSSFGITLLVGLFCAVSAWNKHMENEHLFEGDIVLNEVQKKVLNSPIQTIGLTKKNGLQKHWPKGVPIPYEFAPEFSTPQTKWKRDKIIAALKDYERRTCLRFTPRTNQKQFMRFKTGNGCFTMVGMQYQGNYITLADGCFTHGTLIHEIMHGLGVWHEQSRGDRDKFVKINYHNMKCCKTQFKEFGWTIDSLGFTYDFKSVMHYDPWAFSNGRGPTIEPLDKKNVIRPGNGFSDIDVKQLNAMYCDGPHGSGGSGGKRSTQAPVTLPPRGKLFKHVTSGKCLDLDHNSNLVFSSRCQTRFEVMEGKLYASNSPGMKCGETLSNSSESPIQFRANCNQGFRKIQHGNNFVLKHRESGKCIHPNRGSSYPSDGTKAIIYHDCYAGQRIQFREE